MVGEYDDDSDCDGGETSGSADGSVEDDVGGNDDDVGIGIDAFLSLSNRPQDRILALLHFVGS